VLVVVDYESLWYGASLSERESKDHFIRRLWFANFFANLFHRRLPKRQTNRFYSRRVFLNRTVKRATAKRRTIRALNVSAIPSPSSTTELLHHAYEGTGTP
jgi:hypothetical protein